jgi:hypothetical protein
MIRLHPHPLLLSRQQVVTLSQLSCVSRRWKLLTGVGRGGEAGAQSIIIRRVESLVLYESFNALRQGENSLSPKNFKGSIGKQLVVFRV